ncbi:MAG: flagellar motor protein MotB [Solirubrobacteraceae bacterium]
MAGARKSARGRRRHGGEEEESAERWLLTYADMITLLMALFMVLFSISSVNISKFKTLQQALKEAFSGQILPGGRALEKTGTTESASHVPNPTSAATIMPFSLEPKTSSLRSAPGGAAAAAQQEQQNFVHLKQEIESYAHQHGLSSYVQAVIEPRGLVIRLLTDKLLFASGKATLAPAASPLLEKISSLINIDRVHPIAVEGNTDNVPIHTGEFPSNWELSTARASTVVNFLIGQGVTPSRLSAIGYAEQHPIASNASAVGRARNRRVEIVLQRLYSDPGEGDGEQAQTTNSEG